MEVFQRAQRWYLKIPYSAENVEKCRRIPGQRKWSKPLQAWSFMPTPDVTEYLRNAFPSLDLSELDELNATSARRAPDRDYVYATEPMGHQKEGFNLSKREVAFAYFMEQGTGKTKLTIDNMAYLAAVGEIDCAVVICPDIVKWTWPEELATHMPDYIDYVPVVWEAGKNTKKFNAHWDQQWDIEKLPVVICNVESLSRKGRLYNDLLKLVQQRRVMGVVDESGRIKSVSAERTKNVLSLGPLFEYRRILTGTPVTAGPLDVFSQMKFLDPMILGYESYYAFRARYAVLEQHEAKGRRFQKVVGYQNQEELAERIEPYSFRVLKDECMDLPPKVYKKITVPMSPEQRQLYETVKQEALAEFGDGMVKTSMVLTKMLRLQQIVGGYVALHDPEDEFAEPMLEPIHDTPYENPKIAAVLELIEDNPGPAIFWARFRAEQQQLVYVLEEKAPGRVGLVNGDTSKNEREDIRRAFQGGELSYYVSNPTTGIGITLTRAEWMAYFSNTFSLDHRLQSEDRAHRKGLNHAVTIYDIVMQNSLDGKLISTLRERKLIADLITGDAKSGKLGDWL